MLNELIHRLRGQVWIRAESAFPERVLNLVRRPGSGVLGPGLGVSHGLYLPSLPSGLAHAAPGRRKPGLYPESGGAGRRPVFPCAVSAAAGAAGRAGAVCSGIVFRLLFQFGNFA